MNFKSFLQGLGAAALGGAVMTGSAALGVPGLKFSDIGKLTLAGSLTTAAAYYTKSPLGANSGDKKKDDEK